MHHRAEHTDTDFDTMTTPTNDATVLSFQTTTSTPSNPQTASTTDAINPPVRTQDLLAHIPDNLYDKSATSHLTLLIKALLGDSGVGGIKKAFSQKRFETSILTSRYYDLDAFFAALFGVTRLVDEVPDLSPYYDVATTEQWDQMNAQDASYRARVTEFASSVSMCPTKSGLEHVAGAIIGCECRIYETWVLVDENGGTNPGGAPPTDGVRTYQDVSNFYHYYANMDGNTYGDIEGGHGTFGRTTTANRQEFIVRPTRQISFEEAYHLTRILTALKPAEALLTIDADGVQIQTQTPIKNVAADSTYWEIIPKVAPAPSVQYAYPNQPTVDNPSVEQPRPAMSSYQGEVWSYNGEVSSFSSYTENSAGEVIAQYDYDAIQSNGVLVKYTPDEALQDQNQIMLGRYASDGILVTSPLGARPVVAGAQ